MNVVITILDIIYKVCVLPWTYLQIHSLIVSCPKLDTSMEGQTSNKMQTKLGTFQILSLFTLCKYRV
jgi:hypothetical protein